MIQLHLLVITILALGTSATNAQKEDATVSNQKGEKKSESSDSQASGSGTQTVAANELGNTPIYFQPRPDLAFFQLPSVRPVPEPERSIAGAEERANYGNGEKSLEKEALMQSMPTYSARFDVPAHFPYPRFAPNGAPMPDEGAIIYEGMRLLATPDGQYEIEFTVTISKMPVTLRMQLIAEGPGCVFPLTLPPISIRPSPDFEGNYVGESFQVRLAGHSRLIAKNFFALEQYTFSRQGTARFGSWPDGINKYTAGSSYGLMSTIESSTPTDKCTKTSEPKP